MPDLAQSGASGARETRGGGEEGEGEEEMFFDAHEASAEEWARATRAEFMESSPGGEGGGEGGGGGGGEREGSVAVEEGPPFNGQSMEEVRL